MILIKFWIILIYIDFFAVNSKVFILNSTHSLISLWIFTRLQIFIFSSYFPTSVHMLCVRTISCPFSIHSADICMHVERDIPTVSKWRPETIFSENYGNIGWCMVTLNIFTKGAKCLMVRLVNRSAKIISNGQMRSTISLGVKRMELGPRKPKFVWFFITRYFQVLWSSKLST